MTQMTVSHGEPEARALFDDGAAGRAVFERNAGLSRARGVEPRNETEASIAARRAVRAFTDRKVTRDQIEHLLSVACRAPSGVNMQPWKVFPVAGNVREALCRDIHAAHMARDEGHIPEYRYYPPEFFEPYKARRRKNGLDLYAALDIRKGETDKMLAQHGRNFLFFDAPVGLICTIDRRLSTGSWIDFGLFLQSLLVAAQSHGIDTCPQGAFANFHTIIRRHLPLAEEDLVVCGVALGYADRTAPENGLVTERAPLSDFVDFTGFEM